MSNSSAPTYITDRLGLPYFYKSLYDRIVADFTKSLKLDPTLADAYSNKVMALEAAGRPAKAREAHAAFLRHASPEAREQVEQARRWLQK